MSLGNKTAALTLAERAMTVNPVEKDALTGPASIEFWARVTAQIGETDRAIAALQKLLSIPYAGPLGPGISLTPALLRLDPMFDPLRDDPRFQNLTTAPAPERVNDESALSLSLYVISVALKNLDNLELYRVKFFVAGTSLVVRRVRPFVRSPG